jgi:hypothetical protein
MADVAWWGRHEYMPRDVVVAPLHALHYRTDLVDFFFLRQWAAALHSFIYKLLLTNYGPDNFRCLVIPAGPNVRSVDFTRTELPHYYIILHKQNYKLKTLELSFWYLGQWLQSRICQTLNFAPYLSESTIWSYLSTLETWTLSKDKSLPQSKGFSHFWRSNVVNHPSTCRLHRSLMITDDDVKTSLSRVGKNCSINVYQQHPFLWRRPSLIRWQGLTPLGT